MDIDDLERQEAGCRGINPAANQEGGGSFGMHVPGTPQPDWRGVFDGPVIGPGGSLPGGTMERTDGGGGSYWDRAGDALRGGLSTIGGWFGF